MASRSDSLFAVGDKVPRDHIVPYGAHYQSINVNGRVCRVRNVISEEEVPVRCLFQEDPLVAIVMQFVKSHKGSADICVNIQAVTVAGGGQ